MKRTFKRYLKDTTGNIAMLFGAISLTLFVGTGAAIDLNGIVKQYQVTQDLADIAVLAAATSGYQTKTELQVVAQDAVDQNSPAGKNYTAHLKITKQNAIQVKVDTDYQTVLMGIFGHHEHLVSSLAEAPPRGDGKLNLAMVLDVTGSMQGSKLSTLQTAANQLIDTFGINESAPSGNVMMSVVPFAHYVKIPYSNLGEPWLEVQPDTTYTWNSDRNRCGQEGNNDPNCTPDITVKTATLSWTGCMGGRHAPHHMNPDFGTSRLQGFAGGGSCHSELLPLTTNVTAVKSNIANLTAEDETYIPSGLMWGWRTLSPNPPFTEANTADKNERKRALLLMTDGENTRSYGGTDSEFNGVYHWQQSQTDADTMTAQICTDIKTDGITIYTVAFEVSDTATRNLLRNCASDPGKYFNAENALALEAAFSSIGKELAEVRLAK